MSVTSTHLKEVLYVAKTLDQQLRADDPRFGRCVYVQHEEGTTLFFRCAFIESYKEYIIIFTEHHHYYVYHKEDLTYFAQYDELPIEEVVL